MSQRSNGKPNMTPTRTILAATALLSSGVAFPHFALAQDIERGATGSVIVGTISAGEVDLGQGDTISSSRTVVGMNLGWSTDTLNYGVDILAGRTSYEFGSRFLGRQTLDVDEIQIAVPLSFGVGDRGRVFLSPNLTFHGEDGTSFEDGTSYGLIGGVGWQVSPTLFIGPGIGIASSLVEDDDPSVFPFIVLDWKIAEQWTLSTGSGFAASRGPGLRLAYAPSESWEFGIEARLEEFEFKLDEGSTFSDGVGRDSSTPILVTGRYQPRENVTISGFVGASVGGSLTLFDETGEEVYEEDYETAPLLGIAATIAF